jgi:hypothetical protein
VFDARAFEIKRDWYEKRLSGGKEFFNLGQAVKYALFAAPEYFCNCSDCLYHSLGLGGLCGNSVR